jgi:hypothetical protein
MKRLAKALALTGGLPESFTPHKPPFFILPLRVVRMLRLRLRQAVVRQCKKTKRKHWLVKPCLEKEPRRHAKVTMKEADGDLVITIEKGGIYRLLRFFKIFFKHLGWNQFGFQKEKIKMKWFVIKLALEEAVFAVQADGIDNAKKIAIEIAAKIIISDGASAFQIPKVVNASQLEGECIPANAYTQDTISRMFHGHSHEQEQ